MPYHALNRESNEQRAYDARGGSAAESSLAWLKPRRMRL